MPAAKVLLPSRGLAAADVAHLVGRLVLTVKQKSVNSRSASVEAMGGESRAVSWKVPLSVPSGRTSKSRYP